MESEQRIKEIVSFEDKLLKVEEKLEGLTKGKKPLFFLLREAQGLGESKREKEISALMEKRESIVNKLLEYFRNLSERDILAYLSYPHSWEDADERLKRLYGINLEQYQFESVITPVHYISESRMPALSINPIIVVSFAYSDENMQKAGELRLAMIDALEKQGTAPLPEKNKNY